MTGNDAAAALHQEVSTTSVDSTHGDSPGVDIVEISPEEWCVRDRAVPTDDPRAVLGFIQRLDDAYEVTNLRRLRERSYFSRFAPAAASLASRSSLVGAVRS